MAGECKVNAFLVNFGHVGIEIAITEQKKREKHCTVRKIAVLLQTV